MNTELVTITRDQLDKYNRIVNAAWRALPFVPQTKITTLGEMDKNPDAGIVLERRELAAALNANGPLNL